jgi:hypothetical protein
MKADLVRLSAVVIAVLGAAPAAAQQTAPAGCTSAEHAQFDFWVGSWTVTNTAGATIGRNRIEKVSTGCALLESWTDARGVDGHSINFFDPDARAWHQVWMGSNGAPLRLEGHSDRPGRMILSGTRPTAQGIVHNRITWTLQDDDSVTQTWETSTDDGATWQVGFHGIYRRE